MGMIVATMVGCDSAPPGQGTSQVSVTSENATTIDEDFRTADAWETIAGTWSTAASGERTVLKQTATDQKYPVTLLHQPEISAVDVTVDFRPVSGKIDASGGIVFRAQDGANYYIVRANSLEDNFRLYATVAGSREQIASTSVEAPEIEKWHALRVVAVGDNIQAYLNGKLLIDHHDSRFASGRVGLWTKADAVTEFANFKARGTVLGSTE
jgi:hypothetical protein